MRAGADYLVLGRPIYAADNPKAAAQAIIQEMADALRPD
jgi:orotidine-5'-phosphate decarboxylase